MSNWIKSDGFWGDLIGSEAEARRMAKTYLVPKDWSMLFWGEHKKILDGGKKIEERYR